MMSILPVVAIGRWAACPTRMISLQLEGSGRPMINRHTTIRPPTDMAVIEGKIDA